MRIKIILYILVLLVPVKGFSQLFNPDNKYSSQQLAEDYDYLVDALEKSHPGLYWYTDSVGFKGLSGFIAETITLSDSLTETEFLRKARLLNFAIRCVHTSIGFSKAHDAWWKQNALLLPFNLFTANGKYYVYQNYSENPLLDFGNEILTIDNKPINDIITRISPYIPSDGFNSSRRKNVLKTGFHYYYSLAINETSPTYKISCVTSGTKDTAVLTVKGINYNELNNRRSSLKKSTTPIDLRFIDSLNAAVLKVPTFRKDLFEKEGLDYDQVLDSFFNVLKARKTSNLVIDMRDNGGGMSEYGAVLLSYLTNTAFVYCKNQWLTSDTHFDFIEYDIPETFKGFPEGIVTEDNGYKWKKHSILGIRQPAKNRFKGNIYFIINGGCSSTTAEVIALAKANNIGVAIGEEMGGTNEGNTSGITGWVTLPHTKAVVRIPMVKFELATENNTAVLPDFYIQPTIEDALNGIDKEMDFTLELIKQKK